MENAEIEQVKQSLLKLAEVAPHIYEQLHAVKRTGWVERGVENPESVKEHTEALIRLAEKLKPYLNEEESDGLIEMLEVHDWPEALYGDEVILELEPNKRKSSRTSNLKTRNRHSKHFAQTCQIARRYKRSGSALKPLMTRPLSLGAN